MKYAGMPFGMWGLFAGSFQKQLTLCCANAMMTKPMKWFCRMSGKSKRKLQ